MSFATTKDKETLDRTTLVRFTPGRSLDGLLSGGPVYQMAWSRPVARVERNGVALTKDTASPSTNDHYWYDEANSVLYVKLAAAADATTNIVVVFYYLFAASNMAVMVTEDPLDSSTTLRQWEPRFAAEPSLRQSVRNTIAGVFTVEDATLQLTNADNFWNQWLTNNDSWNEKDVDAWIGLRASLSDAFDFQRVYKGKVKSLIVDQQYFQATVFDAFSRLNQPALMGDNATECYFRRDAASYPNVDPAFANVPVPLHFGRFSWYQTKALYTWASYLQFDDQNVPKAACTSYNQAVSTSNNRTWTLCRVPPDGLKTWVTPGLAPTSVTNSGNSLILFYAGGGVTALDIAVGDPVQVSQAALATHYGRVARIDANDIYIIHDATTTVAYTTSVTITPLTAPSIMIHDSQTGFDYFPCPTTDYTWSTTTTSGGNKLVQIVFVTNFEGRSLYPYDNSTVGVAMTTLDPSRHTVHYRVRPVVTNYGNHADVLKCLCTAAGLTPNTSTFATAKSNLAVNAQFSAPYLDETDYQPYVQYVEDLLESTLGILSIDSSAQVEYLLVAAPSSSDTTDDNMALRDSDSITVEYADVVTQLVASNPHNASQAAVDASPSPSETRTNLKAQYLHGVVNPVQFRHVLETITGRIDQIMAAKSNRQATYLFDVATKYLDGQLGQDLVRKAGLLLGADTTRTVKIFSLDRHADLTTVGAVDLLGVT